MARKKKKDDDLIKRLLKKAEETRQVGYELGKIAAEQAQLHGKKFRTDAEKSLSSSIASAKRFMSSQEEDLKTLEKLGKLKKAGIISEREFQEKKKKILSRI